MAAIDCTDPARVLRAILREVRDGVPYSGDSWLPAHFVEMIEAALLAADTVDVAQ